MYRINRATVGGINYLFFRSIITLTLLILQIPKKGELDAAEDVGEKRPKPPADTRASPDEYRL
jgi:hypothetical protein